ncbi:hypothetical protein, partial [Herbiconiux sp.]|uniref:hypothetical protein n=1 Tax=Herbiconiux sp. TaxID=1871186 RepID=UPI0025C3FA19
MPLGLGSVATDARGERMAKAPTTAQLRDAAQPLERIAQELYAVRPAEFVAERKRHATAASDEGDRELAARVRKLAKPSVAAWAVDQLVRHRSVELDELLALGARLRDSSSLDREAVRDLGKERQRLLAALARSARDLGDELGTPVSESAALEVQATLQAALTDPGAEAALRTGLLVRTLATAGFDPVDLAGALPAGLETAAPATATPGSGSRSGSGSGSGSGEPVTNGAPRSAPPIMETVTPSRATLRAEKRAAAKREAEEARQDAANAAAELAGLELRIQEIRDRRDRLSFEQRELRARIEQLQEELDEA